MKTFLILLITASALLGCILVGEKLRLENKQYRAKALRLIHLPEISLEEYEALSTSERQAFITKGGKIK